jgi:hypothetical protein
MAYEITKVSNKGIVVLSLSGVFDTREVLRGITNEAKQAAQQHPDGVYRIIDARNIDTSFASTTLRLIEEVRRATTPDSEVESQTFVVGVQPLLDLIRYSGMRVCMFSSLEDAVAQASLEIAYRVVSDQLSADFGRKLQQAGQYSHA